MDCELCKTIDENYRVFLKDKHSYAMIILHPLFDLHSMVLPRKHITSLDQLTKDESKSLHDMVELVRTKISEILNEHCITILHQGKMASQKHIHYQIIAMDNGGIRSLIASKYGTDEYPKVSNEVRKQMADKIRSHLKTQR